MPIDPKSVTWDAPDPAAIKWDDETPKSQKPELMQRMQNLAAGGVRGAGSIGATLMAPQDMLEDALTRLFGGQTPVSRNAQRRQGMTSALQTMGADPSSGAFQVGKLGGEIAGTLGVGPALGAAAPLLPARAAPLIDAVTTAGMRAGGMTGPAGMGVRAAGGAITGGASAGLVDPSMAAEGAALGAAMPGAVQLAGKAGKAVGNVIRGPQASPQLTQAVADARAAGLVIPPTQAKPTLGNRLIEGFSGKITTAQNASAKNQPVINDMAAKALGLPAGTKLDPGVLQTVRQQAGQAYDAIGQAGVITPGQAYGQALDKIAAPFVQASKGFPNAKPSPVLDLVESLRSPSFDASSAVAKIKELRSAADDAFRAGNSDIGRASRSAAKALEDAIEDHLQRTGSTQLLDQFRSARQLIAKTYTVEKALNPASGSVDARKLGKELAKGKPLTGELKTAGEFGLQFPKAAQAVEGMGSLPQASPLDWALGGVMSAATTNPLMMLSTAARPGARALALSPLVQNRLATPARNALLMTPELELALLRASPAIAADR